VGAVGSPGAPIVFPDAGDDDPSLGAPAAGKLATSGRDDVERGDTVTGLGAADVGKSTTGPRRGVSPGKQSGIPTPGNRFAREDRDAET
jgi:hypothetical protein